MTEEEAIKFRRAILHALRKLDRLKQDVKRNMPQAYPTPDLLERLEEIERGLGFEDGV